jgi:putative membrane protein insertion efficiency factor
MTRLLCALIWLYRMLVSPLLGPNCRFEPSCAVYAGEAIRRFGPWRGTRLAVARVLRCHPWGAGGFDPVPESRRAPPAAGR